MRGRIVLWTCVVALGIAMGAVPARAQTAEDEGIKVGVKGGWLRSDYAVKNATDIFNAGNGWFIGGFGGGNRDERLGLQGELNFLRKSTFCGCNQERVDLYYMQIAGLGRANFGARDDDAVSVYALGGPALDIKIGENLRSLIIREYSGVDVAIVFGGGLEFGQLLVEARATWGLRNLISDPVEGVKVSSRTFAILGGFRFN